MAEGNEIPNEGAAPDAQNIEMSGDPIEDRARMAGWMPYEDWVESGNSPDDWVGAEAFLVKGEMIQKLKKQSRKISEMEQVVNDLAEHNKKIAEIEYNKALKQMKREKSKAYEQGDFDKVVELDEKMEEQKKQFDQKMQEENQKLTSESTEPNPFEEWVSKPENQWYQTDPILRGAADRLADDFMSSNPNAEFNDVVSYVEKQLAEEMPDRFPKSGGQKKKAAPVNEPNTTSAGAKRQGGKKYTTKDLTEDQRKVAERFVRSGVFENVQEYVDQLAEIGEIGGR